MEALENLMSRRSPSKLAEPAPTKDALDKAMAAAVRAPGQVAPLVGHAEGGPFSSIVLPSGSCR